jgi:hypothetical protein
MNMQKHSCSNESSTTAPVDRGNDRGGARGQKQGRRRPQRIFLPQTGCYQAGSDIAVDPMRSRDGRPSDQAASWSILTRVTACRPWSGSGETFNRRHSFSSEALYLPGRRTSLSITCSRAAGQSPPPAIGRSVRTSHSEITAVIFLDPAARRRRGPYSAVFSRPCRNASNERFAYQASRARDPPRAARLTHVTDNEAGRHPPLLSCAEAASVHR